jgi:hypothetical protein
MPKYLGKVRYWMNSGQHVLAMSFSEFDPEPTSILAPAWRRQVLCSGIGFVLLRTCAILNWSVILTQKRRSSWQRAPLPKLVNCFLVTLHAHDILAE